MRYRGAGITILLASLLFAPAGLSAEQDSTVWLGVYLADEVDGGVRIVAVVPGGPAFRAGLRQGDLMVQAGEVQLVDQGALERALAERRPGSEVGIDVLRDGEAIQFRVRPAVRPRPALFPVPEAPGAPVPIATPAPLARIVRFSGLQTVTLTEELREHYGAPSDRGVLVVRARDTVADLGIHIGDVLLRVGDRPVLSPNDVRVALAAQDRSEPLRLEVVRDRKPRTVELAAEAPRRAGPFPAPAYDRDARVRQLERSIALLERQLEALRRELDEVSSVPRPDPPANPDR